MPDLGTRATRVNHLARHPQKNLSPPPLGGRIIIAPFLARDCASGGVRGVRGVVLAFGEHGQRSPPRTEGPCLLLATSSRAKRVTWSGWERVEKPPNPVGDFGSALEFIR